MQELVEKIPVGAVDLHTVETGFQSTLGGSGVLLSQLLDLFHGHRLWWCLSVGRSIECVACDWNITGADRVLATKERRRGRTTDVPELAVDEGTLCVDSIGDSLPAIHLCLCEDAGNTRVASSLIMMLAMVLQYVNNTSYQSVNGARLGEHEATLASSLRVVFHIQVARVEDAVCFFGRTHACEGRENNFVLEL